MALGFPSFVNPTFCGFVACKTRQFNRIFQGETQLHPGLMMQSHTQSNLPRPAQRCPSVLVLVSVSAPSTPDPRNNESFYLTRTKRLYAQNVVRESSKAFVPHVHREGLPTFALSFLSSFLKTEFG